MPVAASTHQTVYIPVMAREGTASGNALLPVNPGVPSGPATAGSIALGSYRPEFPNDLGGALRMEQASGRPLSIVHWFALWGGWKRDFSRSDLDAVSRHGSLPMITWEPWAGQTGDSSWGLREAVLSGKNDAYIDSWARGMAAYHQPVLLRFAHEMHNQSYPWVVGVNGNTAADYVAAWRHVRVIFARYDTANVKWVWNPNTMGDATADQYEPLYRALYPGDAEVDYVGLDIYNTGPSLDWGAPHWRSFNDVLNSPYAAITAVSSRPLILPEVGSAETGGSKAAWISEALSGGTFLAFPRLRAIVWFDIAKEERWLLGSSSQSFDAWAAAARSLLFASSPTSLLGATS